MKAATDTLPGREIVEFGDDGEKAQMHLHDVEESRNASNYAVAGPASSAEGR
jgi:hypothetical protein